MPQPEQHYADKLTLPIKIDDLMDYPLDGVGIEGINTLSSLIDTYTESSNNFSFIVYDKTGENMLYLQIWYWAMKTAKMS